MTEKMSLEEWMVRPGLRPARDNEHKVIVACGDECDYADCLGWAESSRDSLGSGEVVLTDEQRASVGLPVPDPYAHLNKHFWED